MLYPDKLINDRLGVFCTVRLQYTVWAVRCLAGEGLRAAASAPTSRIGPAMLSACTGEHHLCVTRHILVINGHYQLSVECQCS